ncbi:TPA: hypothetical protein N0F65_010066 [Lagenidium giganteum]|uniref:Ribosomal protein eL8/eL30/eS12/Gadd45 domain-containing protein n=1 Tax=Lagenidium giganteum TaxID=4803 RepID=A0AAV2ZF01_9STRA|nr:TPA: hypothetical protein N0F65_010066 [Lagenidium giganteum]
MSFNRAATSQTEELFTACENGDHLAVAELLKDPNTDINWHRSLSYGATPLIVAIANGHSEIVQLLLDAGADLGELKTPDRNSPLHEAAFRGEPEIMQQLLIKIPLDSNQHMTSLVNLQNQFGNTPLHNAARTGNEQCVGYLLDAEAKVSIRNVNGSLPLHHACYCEKPNIKVARLLIEAGSDVNEQDEQGYTPLMIAAKKDQKDIVQYLLKQGADSKAKNVMGEDALHFATLRENKELIELLDKKVKKTTSTTTTAKTTKAAKPSSGKPVKNPLFQSTPKNFRLGGDIQPKRDVSRFVRWPRYVRIQRQRKILYQRLKVPPSVNQFTNTLDKNVAADLFKLLLKYQPETKVAKTERLRNIAAGKEEASAPPAVLKFGLNHVTSLIENKKAKMVVIAHNVNPIELVVFLPALCRKMDIPYCIVKGKARLGQLVHMKTAAVVALTHVNKEDKAKFDSLNQAFKAKFTDDAATRRKWGGGIMGLKTQKKLELRAKAIAAEQAKKAQY